jgi:MoaA/NifB/PqqE/SkfB family radical SAM enzyme
MLALSDNVYNQSRARNEPKFKLWRSAGVLLTYRCNAACEFCYYHCTPQKGGLMSVEACMAAWRSLRRLAGNAAKIHLTGGEPFLYWGHLVEVLAEGQRQNLGPVDLVETNGFWATDEALVREYLQTLIDLGVRRLKVSVDPFHQEYVDIQPVRLLATIAKEVFGPDRVLVRWEEYLADCGLPQPCDSAYVAAYRAHPFRFTGRAAGHLADLLASRPVEAWADASCLSDFLGAKGVHIDPYGNVFSGTCSGIVVGNVHQRPLEEIWKRFDPDQNTLVRTLCACGPYGLLKQAEDAGYRRLPQYAGKCHLCTHLRQFLLENGAETETVGPVDCYR